MPELKDIFDVTGKSVIVTGGASGLGRAYAEIMAEHGALVCILDLDAEALDKTVSEIGGDVWGTVLDVSDRRALAAAFDRATAQLTIDGGSSLRV